MKRAFISYANDDSATARLIADWLRTHGVEPYWFQDQRHQGQRFVREIERGVVQADLFLVLLSPRYLTSEWCRYEREFAIQREVELRQQFVYVLEIAETPDQGLGFLGTYSRLDATAPLDLGKLDALGAALALDGKHDASAEPAATSKLFDLPRWLAAMTITAGAAIVIVLAVVIAPAVHGSGSSPAVPTAGPLTPSPITADPNIVTRGKITSLAENERVPMVVDVSGTATSLIPQHQLWLFLEFLPDGPYFPAAITQDSDLWVSRDFYVGGPGQARPGRTGQDRTGHPNAQTKLDKYFENERRGGNPIGLQRDDLEGLDIDFLDKVTISRMP